MSVAGCRPLPIALTRTHHQHRRYMHTCELFLRQVSISAPKSRDEIIPLMAAFSSSGRYMNLPSPVRG